MPDNPKTARRRHVVDTVHPRERVERTDLPDHSERAERADRSKMISVRLTTDEFEALSAEASTLGIGPSTLARTLIRRGLAEPSPTPSALESRIEAHLQASLDPDLTARVEALERWVAERSAAQRRPH
ncbi:hypothetical protein [Intrasporangium sp. YIM S08009]|uniref:hypothetical protein n=1 Tax=Intrasporangium zincisolvens TaxID=3080018 RepID=UPI002B0610C3|nr:hypothetical protein [Intrasporangium sp. YIM S08009]